LNSKEKNIITIDLTNDEKIVFSQLGINPLIKLGKEYLTSNNFVRLNDNNKEKERTLVEKKSKQISESKEAQEIEINTKANANIKDKSTKKTSKTEEVVSIDKKDQIELTDEVKDTRKKRRRSSASVE
jgi:ribonuclease E